MGHAVDLQRVFNNLIENARRYAKKSDAEQVRINVICRREADNALLEITDDGPGVPDQEIERLLRPFTRLDTARSQANGAGLGLAIVERLVKRHGGGIHVRNRTEGGLAVQIVLPLA
jgi:two-component system osmolarity sensor histidine kinase EnvZ